MLRAPEKRAVQGNLPGEKRGLRLHSESLPHLMDLLGAGIYTDPELAVIREYACNARDAMDEAGNSDPIRIYLPSRLSPNLRIVDQGVGLNWNDICDVFSAYGASTKRVEGNQQTGSLGIGGKSALAYSDSFVIIARKDGIETTVSLVRTEEGGAEMTKVSEVSTNEHNGVEIQIPSKRWHDFRAKCSQFFKYWPEGSVLVDDRPIARFDEGGRTQKVTDTLYLVKEDYANESTVIMANVPYPVANDKFDITLPYGYRIIAFVGIDEIDFAGSREQLRLTNKTKATLTTIGKTLIAELHKAITADIDASSNPQEALRKATKWYLNTPEGMRPKSWTYKGNEIPYRFYLGEADEFGRRPTMSLVKANSYKLSSHERTSHVPFTTAVDAIWFTGYSLKFTSGHRRRINEWTNQKITSGNLPSQPPHYILCEGTPDMTYLNPESVVDWEEVRKIKLPNAQRSEYGRVLGSYDVLTNNNFAQITADDIDDAEPIYYYLGEADTNSRYRLSRKERAYPFHNLLRSYESGCTTVLIPATREAKLLRSFPDARPVQTVVKELYDEWINGLSDDEKLRLWVYKNRNFQSLQNLDAEMIDDPELKDAIALTDGSIDVPALYNKWQIFSQVLPSCTLPHQDWTNPLDRYPLYQNVSTFVTVDDHLYMYFNAAYAARCIEDAIAQNKTS